MLQENKNIPILMYHSISQSANWLFKHLCISPAMFSAQVDYLAQEGYTLLSVTQLVNLLSKGERALPKKPVVLTFDDGFADFHTSALPVLARYHFPATLYIATGFIGGTSRWLKNLRETTRPMVTWRQITEINAAGIECGAHTHTHPKLDAAPLAQAKKEIALSKDLLEQHLGQEVPSFAYPFGFYSSSVRRVVQMLGFKNACAVNSAMSTVATDRFLLERLMVLPRMSIEDFHELLTQEKASPLKRWYVRARIPVKQTLRSSLATVSRMRTAAVGWEER